MVKTHAATLIATGSAGFLVSGAEGAVAAMVVWAAVLIGSRQFRARDAQSRPGSAERPRHSAHADIYDVIDRLDDLARERNWNLAKRFDIARIACENRTMTIDELERLYDQRFSSAPDKIRQDAQEGPKNDGSV
jgi:hypothetical protein